MKGFWLNSNIFPFQITNQSAAVKWSKSGVSLLRELAELEMVASIFILLLLPILNIISASTIKGDISKGRNRAFILLHLVQLCDDWTFENYAQTLMPPSLLSRTTAISSLFFSKDSHAIN